MKRLAHAAPRAQWYPDAVGDLGPNTPLSVNDFLQVVYKWASGLGVELIDQPRVILNLIGHDPNPNVMPGIRRIVQIDVEADLRTGISKLKVNSFRKKFFLEHVPDREFFARYTPFVP